MIIEDYVSDGSLRNKIIYINVILFWLLAFAGIYAIYKIF